MMRKKILSPQFFDRDAVLVAQDLLGKVIYHRHREQWLSAQVIETEAYYLEEKGSHASLGYTHKRRALFMPPGTIYMYYARGGDSLNISAQGEGNAVLIKSAIVYGNDPEMIRRMQQLNPQKNSLLPRDTNRLCSGQTLLCKSLGLQVPRWDAQTFDPENFFIADVGYQPTTIIKTMRLGIPLGRDEHLPYRFIDFDHAADCTQNPLTKRSWQAGQEYDILVTSKRSRK